MKISKKYHHKVSIVTMINEMSGERHHGDGGGDDESNGR